MPKINEMPIISCNNCGKKIEITPYRLKRTKRHFCNMECSRLAIKKHNKIQTIDQTTSSIVCRNGIILIDSEDIEKVKDIYWYISHKGYAVSNTSKGFLAVHRIIMNCPEDMQIDHINRDPLDNRKSNLRICKQVDNNQNRIYKNGELTGIKLLKRTNKWVVEIKIYGALTRIGCYRTKEEAIAARKFEKTKLTQRMGI